MKGSLKICKLHVPVPWDYSHQAQRAAYYRFWSVQAESLHLGRGELRVSNIELRAVRLGSSNLDVRVHYTVTIG